MSPRPCQCLCASVLSFSFPPSLLFSFSSSLLPSLPISLPTYTSLSLLSLSSSVYKLHLKYHFFFWQCSISTPFITTPSIILLFTTEIPKSSESTSIPAHIIQYIVICIYTWSHNQLVSSLWVGTICYPPLFLSTQHFVQGTSQELNKCPVK